MKEELYELAVQKLGDLGHDSSLMRSYSGRGMRDKQVPAIVSDAPAMLIGAMMMEAAEELSIDYSDILDLLPTREDDMGKLSKVFY